MLVAEIFAGSDPTGVYGAYGPENRNRLKKELRELKERHNKAQQSLKEFMVATDTKGTAVNFIEEYKKAEEYLSRSEILFSSLPVRYVPYR